MAKSKLKNDLGPRGFKLTRVTPSSSYDPCAGIEWQPPRESDELFEALRLSYPGRKTHRERMCEALVEFLAHELNGPVKKTTDVGDFVKAVNEVDTTVDQVYKMSKRPLFKAQAPNSQHNTTNSASMTKSKNSASVANKSAGEDPARKTKDWEDMTVVWKSNVGLTKGARPRRMMTEEERTDYRMRRVRGACVSCKRKKRKCNHDAQPSPSTSTETIEATPPSTVSPGLPAQISPPLPATQPPARPSVRFANDIVQAQLSVFEHDRRMSLSSSSSNLANASKPSDPISNLQFAPEGVFNINNVAAGHSKHDASLYQPATLSDEDLQYCWDISTNELRMLDKLSNAPATETNNLSAPEFTDIANSSGMTDFAWDVPHMPYLNWNIPADAQFQATTTSLFPANEQHFVPPSNSLDPNLYTFAFSPLEDLPNSRMIPAQASTAQLPTHHVQQIQIKGEPLNSLPALEDLEKHWPLTQGQQHVEQWLEQKAIEEHSTAPDPELNPSDDERRIPTAATPAQQQSRSRRKVKFDFATLIDGPPTLSTTPPPAEVRPAEKNDEVLPRAPRSASRHSTGSRMSFSDIISLSSALTTLSMRDGESRRGSVYSGSERNMDDDEEDEEEGEDEGHREDDINTGKADSGLDDDNNDDNDQDDDDSEEWMQWLDDDDDDDEEERKFTPATKQELYEKCIRIKMPKSN